jgi:hypothetical protein
VIEILVRGSHFSSRQPELGRLKQPIEDRFDASASPQTPTRDFQLGSKQLDENYPQKVFTEFWPFNGFRVCLA